MDQEANAAKRPLILVVDDEVDLLELYFKRLSRAGFEVATAANGRDAVTFLRENRCDAVVCDINMPDFNGFDVFNFVRTEISDRLPFVFVTGHGEGTAEMSKAVSLGADGVFTKPLSSRLLVEHLQKLCCTAPPRVGS